MSQGRRISTFGWFGGSVIVLLMTTAYGDYPDAPKNGQIHESDAGLEVWDAAEGQWVEPETFWLNFATRRDSKFWGRTSVYPPYREVGERDTILIELDEGTCLMEFWHRRWRRAQDVRRWDPAFNSYGGCPHVFEKRS